LAFLFDSAATAGGAFASGAAFARGSFSGLFQELFLGIFRNLFQDLFRRLLRVALWQADFELPQTHTTKKAESSKMRTEIKIPDLP
jgi:hypothetical protein